MRPYGLISYNSVNMDKSKIRKAIKAKFSVLGAKSQSPDLRFIINSLLKLDLSPAHVDMARQSIGDDVPESDIVDTIYVSEAVRCMQKLRSGVGREELLADMKERMST